MPGDQIQPKNPRAPRLSPPTPQRQDGETAKEFDEEFDGALASLARGEGHVLIAEQPNLLGRRVMVERMRFEAARRGIPEVHGRATRLDRVAPLSTLVVALAVRGAGASCFPSLDGDRMAALEQVRARLAELADGRGLLVCIDDFHHADELTALALRVLVPALASTPVLWLLSLRPSLASAPVRGVVDMLLETGARRLTPQRLDADRARRLCARVLGAEPDPAVVALVGSAGDRELVERIILALHASGHVRVADGRAQVVDDDRLPLPDWLVTEVRSVLGDLAEPVRALLEVGAVLGRTFTVHEAAALARRPVTALVPVASEAVRAGVLESVPAGLGFPSELTRRVVYAELAGPVRVALHREAADVVFREGRPVDEVLHHVERGGRLCSADVVAGLHQAVREHAGSASEAADLALRLLDVLGETHDRAAALTVDAVALLDAAGRSEEAWDLAERALHRPLDAGTQTRLVCLVNELAAPHDWGVHHPAEEYARRALARQDLTQQQRAELVAVQAYRLAVSGRTEEAEDVLEHARPTRGEAVVLGSVVRAQAELHRGRFARALTLARNAVGEADRIGLVRRRHSRLWLCAPLVALDRFDEAHSALAMVAREAEHLGTAWPEPEWHYQRARTRMARGRLRAAEVDAEQGLRTARAESSVPLLGRTLRLLAEIRTERGDLGGAEANLLEAEQLGGAAAGAAQLTWRRVLWLCAAGRDREAAEAVESLLATADLVAFAATAPSPVAPVLMRLARRWSDERRVEQVVRVADELAGHNPGVPWLAAAASHVRGLRDGDLAAVVTAAELLRQSDRRTAAAAALADAGAIAREQGDNDRARDLFDEAHRMWTVCGASLAAQRVEKSLAVLSGAGPVSRTTGAEDDLIPAPALDRWATLTDTEVRVARLVARGLTNKAIATSLALSPHTIGTHVRNAFSKLRVVNRVELALQVIAHDRARRE